MLKDISNNLKVYNLNNKDSNGKQNNSINLRPLKIVKKKEKNINLEQHQLQQQQQQQQQQRSISSTVPLKPGYKFNKNYAETHLMMFPFFIPVNSLDSSNDAIDLTSQMNFPKNNVKKYLTPTNVSYTKTTTTTINTKKTKANNGFISTDPILSIFQHPESSHRLKFSNQQLNINSDGTFLLKETEQIDTDISLDCSQEIVITPISPIRRANSKLNLRSPITKKNSSQTLLYKKLKMNESPVKTLKEKRNNRKTRSNNYTKLDNSMTISAKAIMKMVDDSLVSSDTEMYSLSQSFILRSNIKDNDISINEDDLKMALSGEMDFSPLTNKIRELKIEC